MDIRLLPLQNRGWSLSGDSFSREENYPNTLICLLFFGSLNPCQSSLAQVIGITPERLSSKKKKNTSSLLPAVKSEHAFPFQEVLNSRRVGQVCIVIKTLLSLLATVGLITKLALLLTLSLLSLHNQGPVVCYCPDMGETKPYV